VKEERPQAALPLPLTSVRLENVRVTYGGRDVIKDVSFTVESGELAVLVGRSGSGKTTLLRAITGYAPLSGGRVSIGGEDVTRQPPARRDIAMVFQSYSLYPHMTVRENWLFPLQAAKLPPAERDARIAAVAATLQMQRLLDRYPKELSGGQQQRVAMGRALVRQPQLFLLDEPLGALDAKLRVDARSAFKTLQRELGATTIYVTHDQVEAQALGAKIVVLDDGAVQQVGTPDEIYDMPANHIVAGLFGSPPMNFLDAELTTREDQVSVACGNMTLPLPPAVARDVRAEGRDREVILGVRPEAIHLAPQPEEGSVPASIYVIEPLGHNLIADVRFGGRIIRARADRNIDRLASLQPDDPVYIRFDAAQIHLFDRVTQQRL
jgi:multiple sugar transport system ATP-binding protein